MGPIIMEIDASYLLDLDSLIDKVKKCGATNVVVAGGAIRDMLLQKEVADIDVFFEGDIDETQVHIQWAIVVKKPETSYTNCKVMYDVTDSLFPVKVQLIQVENIALHIEKFPTPFSRVFYDTLSGLGNVTTAFLECEEEKRLLFDKEVDIFYLTKLQEKFPEYTTKFAKPEFNPELELQAEEVMF